MVDDKLTQRTSQLQRIDSDSSQCTNETHLINLRARLIEVVGILYHQDHVLLYVPQIRVTSLLQQTHMNYTLPTTRPDMLQAPTCIMFTRTRIRVPLDFS